MRNLKAKMLNKKASDLRNKPDQILEALELRRGKNMADIGAGGGYFSLRFAEAVGRIAIIEYKRAKSFTFRRPFGHYVLRETIIKEMKEAGYRVKREFDFLPEQSFTIFSKIKISSES